MKIKKLSGQEEEFNGTKLLNSLRWAGAADEVARQVASQVVPREGMTTNELRQRVVRLLRTKDSAAAERYQHTRVRRARIAPNVSKDAARLHPETLRALGVSAGTVVRLQHAGHTQTLRAEPSDKVALDGIRMPKETLTALHAREEGRVAILSTEAP